MTAEIGDAALVAALCGSAQGDRRAFERLYRLTSARLFAICRRILPSPPDAEEALQNAYLTIWRHAAAYDPARGRPMTWLITVTHRCALDMVRRRRPSDAPPLDFAAVETISAPSAASAPATSLLAECLRGLERRDEALLRNAFFEGATYAELAERSETPLGTIKSRIRRALHSLAECLS